MLLSLQASYFKFFAYIYSTIASSYSMLFFNNCVYSVWAIFKYSSDTLLYSTQFPRIRITTYNKIFTYLGLRICCFLNLRNIIFMLTNMLLT
ncbi:hypothetical protein C0J52_25772 [Blattella germanica]|nr:hypothetical protein C0J52_25772 [Blattella germanica]